MYSSESSFTLGLAYDIVDGTAAVTHTSPNSSPAFLLLNIIFNLFKNPDQQAMQINFNQVHTKLDFIEMQLVDTAKLTANLAVTDKYFEYANDIKFQMRHLVKYLQSSGPQREIELEDFLTACNLTDNDKAVKVFSKGIPEILKVTTDYNNYNKTQTSIIGRSLIDLMVMGVSCSYSYEFLTNGDYNTVLQFWKKELIKTLNIILDYEALCIKKGPVSAEQTIKKFLLLSPIKSQQQFANQLYHILNTTYNWFNWMVLVYDNDVTSNFNVFYCCNGIYVKGKKNIVAFYSDRNKEPNAGNNNRLISAFAKFQSPKIIARRMYSYLRDRGVKGNLFILRRKHNMSVAYDDRVGSSWATSRLYVLSFPE